MKIQGPISVSVQDDDVQAKRTLEINFTDSFKQSGHEQQEAEMKQYIQSLFQTSQTLEPGQPDREGVLLIMQICEHLLPLLQQKELDLDETISLEMGLSSQSPEISVALIDFNLN